MDDDYIFSSKRPCRHDSFNLRKNSMFMLSKSHNVKLQDDEDIEDMEPEQFHENSRFLSPLARLNMKFNFSNNFQYYWSLKSKYKK